MEKKIYRIALLLLVGIFLLAILYPYEPKLIDWSAPPSYDVRESDEIYFNNTRAVGYRTEESAALQQQGFKTHRYNKCLRDTTYPLINFTIVNFWRNDLAYIVAEPNKRDYFTGPQTLVVGDTSVVFDLDHMDFESHYRLAALLFEQQLSYHRPFLIIEGDSLLLYGTQSNEKANQTVLKDYFRLIGKFQ